jgi:hypothetical protein
VRDVIQLRGELGDLDARLEVRGDDGKVLLQR